MGYVYTMNRWCVSPIILSVVLASPGASQEVPPVPDPDAIRFFEMKIRPLLRSNCGYCHNDEKRASGLSVESRASILAGGNRGIDVVPGQPNQSTLIRAIKYQSDLKMPPMGKLSADQIADLTTWVEVGLPWPDAVRPRTHSAPHSDHWAFRAPVRPEPPRVKSSAWCRNPIDRFVLAKLENAGLQPSPPAEMATLVRRLSLDLLGLPPSPAEVDAFLADRRPDAYERLVDRLLASPHYGERWGRHWLDAARYADTGGYSSDIPLVMWHYRDWVTRALNEDMPFDQFTIEQLAGDLLPGATVDQKIATGFHRNTLINKEGGADPEQFRIESIFDRVATTGTVFLGLTIGCAQCHDHKYDPISQREFYQLFAFFNNQEEPTIEVVRPGEAEPYKRLEAEFDLKKLETQFTMAKRRVELLPRMAAWAKELSDADRRALPDNIQRILGVPSDQRTLREASDLEAFFRERDREYEGLDRQLKFLESPANAANPSHFTAMVLDEIAPPRKTHVLIRGDFKRPGSEVYPDTPAVLPPLPKSAAGIPNRLHLARWLVSENNPLTARVTVNRIWQHYFGTGLVKTPEDFGTQGEKPSHAELLDWLATEFVRQRWSLKAMHRLIVTSQTYRVSSQISPKLQEADPENALLARSPRYRVDAEVVRDIALTVSGLINLRIGGPSVFPPQPPGITELSHSSLIWPATTGVDRYRRGLYTFWKRGAPYPGLIVFDAPSANATTVKRGRSNSPMQVLTTLNDEVFFEAAQHFALRILGEALDDDTARLRFAFRACVAREPDAAEMDLLRRTLQRQTEMYQADLKAAQTVLPPSRPEGLSRVRYAAWLGVARVLLNLDETITRE